jgi:cardiolipin synthase
VRLSLRQLPNLISVLRILLIVPIAVALAHDELLLTLALVVVAALSDAADGFLARRFGWQSELGSILDPTADKALLATVFVTLALQGAVPVWLAVCAVARDVVIVAGVLLYRLWSGPLRIRPTWVSKFNTLCQLVFIASVVAHGRFAVPPDWALTLQGALVLVTVVISGLDYGLVLYGRVFAPRAAVAR